MEGKVVIGWREKIELPDFGIHLKAKIDTGAKSSSLDVSEIQRDGERVSFKVHVSRKKESILDARMPIHRITNVKSSNGKSQERYVVLMQMLMGGVQKEIEVTLTCRKNMLHRMLLGREALRNDFLIDAGLNHLTSIL
jgi:hypothetical protein